MASLPATKQGRQQPGAACEECRRRKLRCDRQQPACSACLESGSLCKVTVLHSPRGPKKGYLKTLRNRVAMLETQLVAQQQGSSSFENADELVTSPAAVSDAMVAGFPPSILPTSAPSVSEAEVSLTSPLPGIDSLSVSSMLPEPLDQIPESTERELDQLYFDRVHASIPILHQRRYSSWAESTEKKTSRVCLQYAMWTLATLLSAQFQRLQESFYQRTKQMLESMSLGSNREHTLDTEQVQAWILVATYESMRTYHQQAWMSAGRAFRLVQLMRLHELDSPTNSAFFESDFIEVEEKRRVFWMAYFLDHLFSMRNSWPVTLNEHVICTRLPAPEMEFQSGQLVLGSFLSEAVIETSPQVRSPFNECVILATICGRSLFHGQQHNIRRAYGDMAADWSDQNRWLESILATRLQILSQFYPSPTETYDPMLLFANIIGQTSFLYLYKGMGSAAWPMNSGGLTSEYHHRAMSAVEKIIDFARVLREFHISKIHPLMPIPLLLTAEFLYTHRSFHRSFSPRLQDLLDIFRQLKNVNNHKESYIHLLELTCTSTSLELAKDTASLYKEMRR